MTDSKPLCRQACARHRRQPRHRRGDRRSAGERRRARHPRRAHVGRARGGRGADPRRRRKRDDRAARPHRGREHRQARRRGRRALGQARRPRPQRRDARIADAGAGHRSQGIFAAAQPQPARQPGADRRVRSAARARRSGPTSSRSPRRSARSRAHSGAPTDRPRRRSKRLLGAYADETAYTGRIRVHIVDPGATRTRMRALAFPGEEPESVKPPEVVARRSSSGSRPSADRRENAGRGLTGWSG